MGRKYIDLTGQTCGNWSVLERDINVSSNNDCYWICRCKCGNKASVKGVHLRGRNTIMCAQCRTVHGHARKRKHTKTYRAWVGMRVRCNDPKMKKYQYYGGRGIKVCERWLTFENFLADMGESPLKAHLDRIDNDGHYEPSNCRWVTPRESHLNRRCSKFLTVKGVRAHFLIWAELTNTPTGTMRARKRRGWSDADVVLGRM